MILENLVITTRSHMLQYHKTWSNKANYSTLQGLPAKGMNRLVMEHRVKVSIQWAGCSPFSFELEIWIIKITSQNQWYHELGPGRANLLNGLSGAHNPKVLEVLIIAILLQTL